MKIQYGRWGAPLIIILAIGGYLASHSPTSTKEAHFSEIAQYVRTFSDPTVNARSAVVVGHSLDPQEARRAILDRLDKIKSLGDISQKDLREIMTQDRRRLEGEAEILGKIAQADDLIARNSMVAPPELIAGLCVFAKDKDAATCDEATKNTVRNVSLRELKSQYADALQKLENERHSIWEHSLLPLLAAQDPGAQVAKIGVDFDECWCSKPKQDFIALKNMTSDNSARCCVTGADEQSETRT